MPPLEVVDANPCRQHRHRRTRPEILTFFRPPESEYDRWAHISICGVYRSVSLFIFDLDVDGDDSVIDLVRDVDLHREHGRESEVRFLGDMSEETYGPNDRYQHRTK